MEPSAPDWLVELLSGSAGPPSSIRHFSVEVDGSWTHTFLSNGFIEPDETFVEREYQSDKTTDAEWAARIMGCAKPFGSEGSKQLGRQAPLRPDWDEVKFQCMARRVFRKFLDHPELASLLLKTGDALLIEGNSWHDNIWGDCSCGRPECAAPGLNWLGLILMNVREALRQHP